MRLLRPTRSVIAVAGLCAALGAMTVNAAQPAFADAATAAPRANRPADAIDTLGRSTYADIYGGLRLLADDESRIEVYLTSLDAAAEKAFAEAGGPAVQLTFAKVLNSAQALAALEDKLAGAAESLRAEGVELSSYGPDVTTGKLLIGLLTVTEDASSRLDDLLGAENVEIVQQDAVAPVSGASSSGKAALFGHAWHVKRIVKQGPAGARVLRHGPVTLSWRHGKGADVVTAAPCTTASVTVAGHHQTYGPFITPTSTSCASHDSIATDRFVYGRLLVGTVTWRVSGRTLVLHRPGVGRMVLTRHR